MDLPMTNDLKARVEEALGAYRSLTITERTPETDIMHDLATNLYALLADNEALRKEREWQTIETAPKDGTQFLIGRVGWSGVRVAWWSPYREDFVTGPSPMDRVVDANRWQPLPTPPQTQGGDDARD